MICLHRCIEHLRKRKRGGADRTDSLTGRRGEISAADPSPERSADHALLMARVKGAFTVLSPRQKIIFDMKHFQSLEIPEIASMLECSESAVKTHLGRAVAKLRKRVAPIMEEL
jgi:RNA polymerase sigma-70 factor (ECF subfamily)